MQNKEPILTEADDKVTDALKELCSMIKEQLNAKGADLGLVHAAICFLPVDKEMKPAVSAGPAVVATFGNDPFIMNAVAGIVGNVALNILEAQQPQDGADAFASMLGVSHVH